MKISRMQIRKDPKDRSERGQSLSELSVLLTVIMVLLAGILDVGRVYYSFLALKNAAAEGAAYGSIEPLDLAGIESRTIGESPSGLIDWSNVTVTSTIEGAPCRGNTIKVHAAFDYTIITPFIGTIIGGQSLPLTAEVSNSILAPACP
ncbi:MAG: hypothetical protein GTO18_04930 [Anaerolineales bacterium]|nr:hypothetical protein [Anaerolineales bacterium]